MCCCSNSRRGARRTGRRREAARSPASSRPTAGLATAAMLSAALLVTACYATDTAPGFDLWAPTYDTDAVELGWVAPEQAAAQLLAFVPALKALRAGDAPLRALDAGCGTGLMEGAWRALGIQDVPTPHYIPRSRGLLI